MKLFTKGLLLIAVPSLAELALVGMLSKTQEQASEAGQWAAHSKQVLYQASVIVDPLLREASRVRAGLIVGDPSFIDRHIVWVDLGDRLSRLEKLVADDPLQVERVRRMREAVNAYRIQTDQIYAALRDGQRLQRASFDSTPLPAPIQSFRDELNAFVADESRLDAERSTELAATRGQQRYALIAAIVGSMLIWAIAALAFAGNIGRRLRTLTANAQRLGRSQALGAPLAGNDELAQLDAALHRTSARLTEAEHDQAALQATLETRAQELTQVNDNLRQQKQDNDMFIYSVSHDLRSPLVNLQGFSKELQVSCDELDDIVGEAGLPLAQRRRMMQILDGDLRESLRYLRGSVTRASAIIDALLRISRVGRLEYQWQRVNVARVVSRVVDALHDVIGARAATVTVRELPPAWGDPAALEQIFGNLIGNALNYLDPSRGGRIEIGALAAAPPDTGDPRTVRMRTYYVRDNGLGIPAAYLSKVFRAFQRLHGDVASGDGIGLVLVRRAVERHGGRVWVESAEGAGSTFFVVLPEQPPRL